jgi:hypothetical protein
VPVFLFESYSESRFQKRMRVVAAGLALMLLLSGCAFIVPTFVLRLLGYEHRVWKFYSGENAIYFKGDKLPEVTPEQREAVRQKWLRGEPLTGRKYDVYCCERKPKPTDAQWSDLAWTVHPLEKRPSRRPDADEEWEYDWCIIYYRRDLVVDLQFKETPNEPQPIYRWSGKEILNPY